MITQKKNVQQFNQDVQNNGGYEYTTNARFSSRVANKRMTDATLSGIQPGIKTVIDIGCGDGAYTSDLKKAMPNVAFTGFDPAAEAIEIAKEKYPSIEFFVGDLLDEQTFPDKRFDLAIIRGVIHHLPDAGKGIKNGGLLSDKVLIIEPNGNNPILKWLEKNSKYHVDHEEQSYSTVQLTAFCNKANLKVKKIDYVGYVPFFFPTLPAKIIYFFQPLLERIYPLKKYFGAQIVLHCERQS
jgi:SAM-dependent methyltransferase